MSDSRFEEAIKKAFDSAFIGDWLTVKKGTVGYQVILENLVAAAELSRSGEVGPKL